MGLSSPGHTAVGTDMGRENGAGKVGPCGLTTLIEALVQCANVHMSGTCKQSHQVYLSRQCSGQGKLGDLCPTAHGYHGEVYMAFKESQNLFFFF